jgi:N-acetyl sugar amidotransferase
VVAHAKSRSTGYDCVIPVSGGKDSTWQVVTCLEHGLKPLAVTWRPPGRTAIGQKNLDNLVSLGVDHIDYSIDPRVEKKFTLLALERYGTPALPMHMAIFALPVTIAARFGIPLVIWGENSAFEYGGGEEARRGFKLDRSWLAKHGVTHGTTAADWVGPMTEKELTPYFGPSEAELEAKGILAIFLGYYFRWDPQMTTSVAEKHGFVRGSSARTGIWDYADIDDDFISIHHWLKWYKFGFTRSFDNLSVDIRNGRLAREEAIEMVRRRGDETPHADIEKFCAWLGITEVRFFEIVEKFRNRDVWVQRDGKWMIDEFLIPEWSWT